MLFALFYLVHLGCTIAAAWLVLLQSPLQLYKQLVTSCAIVILLPPIVIKAAATYSCCVQLQHFLEWLMVTIISSISCTLSS